MTSISLPTLFARALSSTSKALYLPTIEEPTQELLRSALADLTAVNAKVNDLSLFSPNESVDDISTRDLAYLTVPYVLSEVQGRLKAIERDDRIRAVYASQRYLQTFLSTLSNYEIIPEEDQALHQRRPSAIANAASRRELKIKQYQKENQLRVRIEIIRKRRRQLPVDTREPNDFDLIRFLLPSTDHKSEPEDDGDEEDEETGDVLREATIMLLRLLYAQAHGHLTSMEEELELLRSAPPPPEASETSSRDTRSEEGKEVDDMWTLDTPTLKGLGGDGPLLDESGKPLRPFTILPSSDRVRLQSQVFAPDHRLPTMSIDEYLEVERARGKFISGGGAASAEAPTSSEQLLIDSEMDGTSFGEEKAELRRAKDENWARYTDENPKGAGNTMNRG